MSDALGAFDVAALGSAAADKGAAPRASPFKTFSSGFSNPVFRATTGVQGPFGFVWSFWAAVLRPPTVRAGGFVAGVSDFLASLFAAPLPGAADSVVLLESGEPGSLRLLPFAAVSGRAAIQSRVPHLGDLLPIVFLGGPAITARPIFPIAGCVQGITAGFRRSSPNSLERQAYCSSAVCILLIKL